MPGLFRLFFRDKSLKKVCNWINAEGSLAYKDKWVTINQSEYDKFLCVVILVCVYKSNKENVAQLWSKENGRPIFNKLMSQNRFFGLMTLIHEEETDLKTNSSLPEMSLSNGI